MAGIEMECAGSAFGIAQRVDFVAVADRLFMGPARRTATTTSRAA